MVRAAVLRILYMGDAAQPAQAANSTALVSAGLMPFADRLHDSQTNTTIHFNGLVYVIARRKSVSSSQGQGKAAPHFPQTLSGFSDLLFGW